MGPVLVEGKRLRLRELAGGDHALLCRLWSDPAVVQYMAFDAMTPQQVHHEIAGARAEARSRRRGAYTLGAATFEDNMLVGTMRISTGAQRSVYCSHFTTFPEVQSQGYATEIAELTLQFCFRTLQAHRVWGNAHEGNVPAQKLMVRMGMTAEGRTRDFFYARGAWHNVLTYSLLESEWQEALVPAGR